MASIRTDLHVFTLINTFTVAPEHQKDVIRSLHDVTETATRGMPGFVSCVRAQGPRRHACRQLPPTAHAPRFEAMLADARIQSHLREARQLVLDVMSILCSVAYVGESGSG